MSYKVKINVFEGPFDLLVYLIENAQMSIYDIQVSEITAQYLNYIEEMKQLDVALAGEFMVLAGQLIEIKSKMILPRMQVGEDGVLVEEDPRTELVERLLEYKRFKQAADMLSEAEEDASRVFEKPQEDISQYTDEPDEYLSLDIRAFVRAFNLFLERKQRIEAVRRNYTRIERQRRTVEAKMRFIKGIFKVKGKRSVNFRELLEEKGKYDEILTFTSLLEMAKDRMVGLKQTVTFGNITVTDLRGRKKEAEAHDE